MEQTNPTKPSGDEYIYLVGHTPFKQYIDFMATEPVNAQQLDRKVVAEDWRKAHEYLKELQKSEPKWADHPEIQAMPSGLEELVARVHADPIYKKSFSYVPAELGVVPLDRLVIRQKTINLAHVQRIKERLGGLPEAETIFQLCLPFDHPVPPCRSRVAADNTFVFHSESNDLRFLDALVLTPEQTKQYQAQGPVAGIVGIVIGYGSNYLNVIAAEGRLVLNNGSHRSYALRELGVTHVPCVIQKVSTREELQVVGAGALRRNPDLYLREPRPPVLKDYFDPQLRQVVVLTPTARQVRVNYTIEELDVPSSR